MRFLVDECAGLSLASWLREQSHEVFSIYDEARGMSDKDLLVKASLEGWIVITCDKDFGEKVYREKMPHRGIVFLRLKDERPPSKIAAIDKLLRAYRDQIADAFIVVSETQVRFGQA